MGTWRKVRLLACVLGVISFGSALTVEEELEQFMRGKLSSVVKNTKGKPDTDIKPDNVNPDIDAPKVVNPDKISYTTEDAEKNSTTEVIIEEKGGNFSDSQERQNGTSNVAQGEPAFGEGIGSGFHGYLPPGSQGHNGGIQGHSGFHNQRNQGGYTGFGSPEVDGQHIGSQGLRPPGTYDNFQQGFNGNIGRPRVPDGRMGLPRPDGCLCNGPILNPCCFEPSRGVIRRQDGQQPGGHHSFEHHHPHHKEQQSGLKLPGGKGIGGQNFVKQQTPIGLEYAGDFTCPVTNGNFPHPRDCSRFLQCAHSVAYDTPCPDGLLYDTTTGMCNWPDLVRCNTPTGSMYANQIYNTTLLIPSTWQVPWAKCRSLEVAVNAVLISVTQAILGKPCPNSECQFPYIIVNCLKDNH